MPVCAGLKMRHRPLQPGLSCQWVSWAQPRPAAHPRDLHHPRPSRARTFWRAGAHRPQDPVQHGHVARGWPKDSAAQMDCQCAPSNAPRKGVAWWTLAGSRVLPATPQAACAVQVCMDRMHAKRHPPTPCIATVGLCDAPCLLDVPSGTPKRDFM